MHPVLSWILGVGALILPPWIAVALTVRSLSPKWIPTISYFILILAAHIAWLPNPLVYTIPLLLAAAVELAVFAALVTYPVRWATEQDIMPLWLGLGLAMVPAVCFAATLSSTVLPYSWRGWIGIVVITAGTLHAADQRQSRYPLSMSRFTRATRTEVSMR